MSFDPGKPAVDCVKVAFRNLQAFVH